MGIRVAWLVGAALALTGCLSFDEARCTDGTICPAGTRCGAAGTCIPLSCGNGVIEGTEQCEPGRDGQPDNLGGLTCASFGSKIEEGLLCTQECKLDRSGCPACGDGVMQEGEQCDGTDFGPGGAVDCRDMRAGFYDPGTVACSAICTWDVSGCTGRCGDGIKNGMELCDGAPPPGETCLDAGFDGGRLGCSQCGRAFAGCLELGWRRVGTPVNEQFQAIWGTAPDDFFVVGTRGTILRWNGTVFTTIASPTTNTLTGVWGSASNDVYFVGFDTMTNTGVILRYNGTSVTQMTTPALPPMRGIWGTGANNIYAVGDAPSAGANGTLVHYNGAWSVEPGVPATTGRDLRAIWGTGANDVFVVGELGTVLHYNGAWTLLGDPLDSPVDGANQADLAAIWGSSATDVFAVSQRREVFHFDGAWAQSPVATPAVGTSASNVAITGGTADDVFIVGTDIAPTPAAPALLHFDGSRWAKLVPPTTGYQPLRGVWRAPNGDVWAAGLQGYVLRWGGAGWTTATNASARLRGVAAFGSSDAIAVGDGGVIRKYDGSTWATHTSNTTNVMFSVWAPTASFASSVGAASTFRHSTGGTSWSTPTSSGASVDLLAVWGETTNNIFAGGLGGAIRRFDGASWTAAATTPPATIDVFGLWGTTATNVVAVGQIKATNQGAIYRFQGSTWTDEGTIALGTAFLQGIWGAAVDHIFTVGDAIFHYGTAWARMTANGRKLHAVSGTGPRNVFAVGDEGSLLHYDGIEWTAMRVLAPDGSATTTSLRGVAATSRSVVVVGDNGFVQRLSFSKRPKETNCRDTWDDDGDGLPDCADPDCAADPFCEGGGACAIAQQTLACGSSISGSTVGRVSSRDHYLCSAKPETGPDATFRFTPSTSTSATVTLTFDPANDLDLVVVGSTPASRGCDPDFACLGAGTSTGATETVTLSVTAGSSYYVTVDGHNGAAGTFTLSVACP